MSEKLKYDVVVVGAGPAGLSAAIVLARAGVRVIVIERGRFPGAKNVMGGVFYSDCMKGVVDNFPEGAPVERHIIEQRIWMLDDGASVGFSHKNDRFNQEPYNCFTVFRAKFDRWLAGEAEKAGALIINNTVVKEPLMADGKVVGVRTDRPQGDVYADCVIVADGVNSLFSKSLGLRKKIVPAHVALAVKEVIGLDEKVINDRFNVRDGEGVTIEMTGSYFNGETMAFLYTNKKSLSLGVGMILSDMIENKVNPNDLIEHLKKHPSVAPLIEGGETKEYLAHLIPEGGYKALPKLVFDGGMIAGDAAMMVDSIHREGSNLAVTSGKLAAETYLEAAKKGDFSEKTLSLYVKKLEDSFVLKDLKKYKRAPELLHTNKALLQKYPKLLNNAAFEMLKVDGVPKKDKEKLIWKSVKKEIGIGHLVKDLFKLWRDLG
ncbi:FAD-dependent oxidoreductase [Candidatus Sulfidibacterium hydrothermale]|uniref:FAD-dependent oxidoreductase n=1 Tax=Candidatus Sulfidibacterium hydrothermale TaxID=2875962 RepID=UPI001F0B4907|nr:FAD-dependent oxidoreductase [Candidatus Sulfidibacterium hydrothermale]UBM61669.1 FAD-dependent oxidoreductase [Candidatus Sulfidibacterium hydrothermale]